MMQTTFREEEFSFRFTKLSPDLAGRLRERLSDLEMESRRPDVISLPLRADTDYEALAQFIASEELVR